ncbi:Cof-type HAD-IIB family hydrolase [Bacillus dakarensis]|uniref:Cof-type HAD-IIB family hydrolase n=1 Tax=Robertmurraya dakarensis TaxID=1926278 RepID=UPI0009809926|nr:Cof-type HAD-IIB family hydrolase [Bacillus dakarensis]
MKKIVFFDIDGTLLDHDKKLPAKTKEAIQLLKRSETFVAIATGRAPFMFESLRKELDIDSFVSFNGQYVVFENEVIYKNPLDHNELNRLISFSKSNNHPIVLMNEKTMKATVSHHDFIKESMASLKFAHPEKDEDFYLDRDIYQSLLFCKEGEENKYIDEFNNFLFLRWHPLSTDVIPMGGSKAEGISKMIERLGFELKDVYAFGDGLNDIEMIKTVGTGVALGNAKEEVKKHADLITKDVGEDGIWYGLKELDLI